MTFRLIVLSPNGVVFDGVTNYCYVPASNGPIGILPQHTPLIARISARGGVLHFKEKNGRVHYYAVKNGAIEVKKEKTLVLIENYKKCSSIEEAKSMLESLDGNERKIASNENDIKIAEAFSQKDI